LAHSLGQYSSNLSNLERGLTNFSDEMVQDIRVALDAEWIPIYSHERAGFKERLLDWYDTIADNNLTEAKDMQPKLAVIKCLPMDSELNFFYDLFNCRLFIGMGDYNSVADILLNLEKNIEKLDMEQQYYFCYNKALLENANGRYSEALELFEKAQMLMQVNLVSAKEKKKISYNIALCYNRLGFVFRAIALWDKTRPQRSGIHKSVVEFYTDIELAKCYIFVGLLSKANELLNKCYKTARRNKNKTYLADVLLHKGYLDRVAKRWKFSVEHLDKVFDLYDKDSINYLEAVYQKSRCYLDTRYFSQCQKLIEKGKKLSKGNETYTILFTSLENLMALNSSSSVEYMENVALPYLDENKIYPALFDYSEVLLNHYNKVKGNQARANELMELVRNINKKMREGSFVK